MSEHDEQVVLMMWAQRHLARWHELELLYAVPNGAKLPYGYDRRGSRYSNEATRMLAEGLKPGIPDLCLPVARNGKHGLYLEMKFGRNKPQENQVRMMDLLDQQGYQTAVAWSSIEAEKIIAEYLEPGIVERGVIQWL